jgi:D-alanyl-D-alanine carboxypeptidase
MKWNKLKLYGIVVMMSCCRIVFAQKVTDGDLYTQLHQLITPFKAVVGVAVLHIESGDTMTVNNSVRFPMQSVYKFPLAIAVLHRVDNGTLFLQQKIRVTKEDLLPNTWSPLATAFPNGNIELSIEELLDYTVSKSDNNTCDILFRLMGGPKEVESYIHQLGYTNISIKTTEAEMNAAVDAAEKPNWCQTSEMTRLLGNFMNRTHLSDSSNRLLMKLMIQSSNSANRMKGLLPDSVLVAHKTGTGNRIVNDVGIVTLPDGTHLALAVFIKDAKAEFADVEKLIARISLSVYQYYAARALWRIKVTAILNDTVLHPFNGIVLIGRKGKIDYAAIRGFADIEHKQPLDVNHQFVIGSISKQFTAVMVLREYEKQHLQLFIPIKKYLPEIQMGWADTVTVHQLLTHMHGIRAMDQPGTFVPGTQLDYGQADIGYRLLTLIVERVSGITFAQYSMDVFNVCGMKHTFHPEIHGYKKLVKGYTEQTDGELRFETESFRNAPAAGGFISTAGDLLIWNEKLHGGILLKPETYRLLVRKKEGAIRQHPIFGEVYYGYGITVSDHKIRQLGQTGFAPGFVSMDYYFPETQTSVIVLENVTYQTYDLKRTFYHHIQLLDCVKSSISK